MGPDLWRTRRRMAIHLDPTKSISDLFSQIGSRADRLDYSQESMVSVETLLEEASRTVGAASEQDKTRIVESYGWYIIETGRKMFGGRYACAHQYNSPVLIVCEPQASVAIIPFPKVAGRLSGD